MPVSLKDIFNQLVLNQEFQEDSYSIESGVGKDVFVGISPDGHPAVLLMLNNDADQRYDSINLNGIKTEFSVNCNYHLNKKDLQEATFNIVICTDSNIKLQDFFFDFFGRFFAREQEVSTKQLKDEIDFIRELFANQKSASREKIMGLWSELFIIFKAEDTDTWVNKWPEQIKTTFDFEFGHIGLDVKSFGGNERIHNFKLEQLSNKSVEQTIILSTCCKEDELGMSIFDLLEKISKKIVNKELLLKLEKKVYKLNGPNVTDIKRFNFNVADEELRILEGSFIPKIQDDSFPSTVTEIRFKSNCSDVPMLPFSEENQAQLLQGVLVFPNQ